MCAEAWGVERTVGMETHILRHIEQCMPTTQMNPHTPDNEVARLRERLETSTDLIHEIRMDRNAKTAEIARLKKVTNEVEDSFKTGIEVMRQAEAEIHRLKDKLKHAVYLLESYNPTYADVFKAEFK